jgi:hypothetical protein
MVAIPVTRWLEKTDLTLSGDVPVVVESRGGG